MELERYPSPLPLWPTPWYLRMIGKPKWRYRNPDMTWHYLPNSEYKRLFG